MPVRRNLIAVAVLGTLLLAPLPDALARRVDDLRFRLAAALAAPFHALAGAPIEDPPAHAAQRERAAAWSVHAAGRRRAGENVPVIADAGPNALIIGAGWSGGVRVGQWAVADGVFLGFVDRVEEHLARVRLTRDPDLRYGASIRFDGDRPPRQQVLLRGDRGGLARAQLGRALETGSVGAFACRGRGLDLLIGRVESASGEDEPVVRLSDAADRRDAVALLDARDQQPVQVRTAAIFATRAGRVLAWGDAAAGLATAMIDVGRDEGLSVGDVVGADGAFLGRVERVGAAQARLRLRPEDVATIEVPLPTGPESLPFTRGREPAGRRPAPPGLVVRDGVTPAPARAIVAHVFLHDEALARLRRGVAR